jgi:TatD DNase family protein
VPTPALFDTHCHLGYGELAEDAPEALVARAHAAGVTHLLDVGVDAASSRRAAERARQLPGVHFAAGLHPNEADRFDTEWPELRALAQDPRCIAVGETGLDYHWDKAPRDVQRRAFAAHLELGARLDKAVIVHARKALDDAFAILADHRDARVVLHCFAGDERDVARAAELGCRLSFAGPLTYPNAAALRRAACAAPAELLLVETDAPFLAPQSRRGKRNEPAFVVEVAQQLAALRGVDFEGLAASTSANARALFALG